MKNSLHGGALLEKLTAAQANFLHFTKVHKRTIGRKN